MANDVILLAVLLAQLLFLIEAVFVYHLMTVLVQLSFDIVDKNLSLSKNDTILHTFILLI